MKHKLYDVDKPRQRGQYAAYMIVITLHDTMLWGNSQDTQAKLHIEGVIETFNQSPGEYLLYLSKLYVPNDMWLAVLALLEARAAEVMAGMDEDENSEIIPFEPTPEANTNIDIKLVGIDAYLEAQDDEPNGDLR